MANDHKSVIVSKIPQCDFCSRPAAYDGKTSLGPWGYMCAEDFKAHGKGLGLGLGQKLILRVGAI